MSRWLDRFTFTSKDYHQISITDDIELEAGRDSHEYEDDTLVGSDLENLNHDAKELLLESTPQAGPSVSSIPWRGVFYVAVNTIFTIAITFLNKIVVQDEQLRSCQTSFAMFHFTCTFLVLFAGTLIEKIRLPPLQVLPLCFLSAGFLILGNISLQLNNIEFYTLAKLMTCPTVVLLNFLLLKKKVSGTVIISIVLLTGGVMLANGKAGLAKPFGALIAVAAFTVTAGYQVCIQKKITDLRVTAPQLLLNMSPLTAVLLLGVAPFTDTMPVFAHVRWQTWAALLGSGLVASLINISQFLIIGATSALTFNVIGIVKVVSILSIGWFLEGTWPTLLDLSGSGLALGGAWLYAHASSPASSPAATTSPQIQQQLDDVEAFSDAKLPETGEEK